MIPLQLRSFFLFLFLFYGFWAFSQSNNECSTAIPIPNPENFCSAAGAGTTVGATNSGPPSSSCFGNNGQDVWFSFVAIASEATIIIRGLTFDTPGGTLLFPTVALYRGPCSTLTEVTCESAPFLSNIVELTATGLTPGETYYFRVKGSVPGSFQYCIRNYFFNGTLSGDCPTAVVLCDKSPFNVEVLEGAGNNTGELDDAPCLGGEDAETNSTWYVFTAANSGTLEFTLTPNNATDDLDFAVYRLPNGPGNCAGKSLLRCMAAGDAFFPSPCIGPTGLNSTSTDINEEENCDDGQDNFLAALNLVAGTTYALAVNNFTASGNGFQIEWGGTGTFLGPSAGFITNQPDNTACVGETVIFTDTSIANGGIINNWHWNFGVGAQPETADTPGPHTVQYTTPGTKIISLRIETTIGCDVTVTRTLLVETCCDLSAGFTRSIENDTLCLNNAVVFTDTSTAADGSITTWNWNFGAGAQPPTANTPGPHTVEYTTPGNKVISLQITTSTGCDTTASRTLVVNNCCGIMAGFVSSNADSAVCLGKTVIFTDTSTTNNGTITTWNWDFGEGAQPQTGSAAGPYTIQYTTTGVKTISLRVETAEGCDTMITRTVVVDSCCSVSANFVTSDGDSTSCLYAAIRFTDTSVDSDDMIIDWRWEFGAGAQPNMADTQTPLTVAYSTAGIKTVSLEVETAAGCKSIIIKQIEVDTCCGLLSLRTAEPENCAEPCTSISVIPSVLYLSTPLSYAWSSGQTEQTVENLEPGDYIVTVTDELAGCSDTISFNIAEIEQFDIPNAFTPNGDSKNDVFFPVGHGFEVLEFAVYSRWGQKVWSGTSGGWDGRLDGKELPSDVYVYQAKVRYQGEVKERKGEVMLLR